MSDSSLPTPWANIKFEPKVKKLNMGSAADADVLKAVLEDKNEMPWEPVTLPSRGMYYNNRLPGGVVEVRPMGLDTDQILATQRLAQSGKALEILFRKCVKLPDGLDPLDLLAGDRTFLLYYLRGITLGNIYEYTLQCTNKECERTSTFVYDMNNLVAKIEGPKPELGEEPFRVELPYLTSVVGKPFWVKIRFMRGHDLQKMTKQLGVRTRMKQEVDAKGEPLGIDDTISQNMSDVIVEVMGDPTQSTIKSVVNKLHSLDAATIREFINKAAPGIDAKIEVICPICDNTMTMELPITESFFRPSKSIRLG